MWPETIKMRTDKNMGGFLLKKSRGLSGLDPETELPYFVTIKVSMGDRG